MRPITIWIAAVAAALLLAAVPVLLDGPSEIDTAQAAAEDLQDAIASARIARKGERQ